MDMGPGVSFLCSIDGGGYSPCTGGVPYQNLSTGPHTFSVEAKDVAGNISSPASFTWQVNTSTGTPFTVTGDASGQLYPGGAARSIPAKIFNPNNVPITVTSMTVSVQRSSLPSGCVAASFKVTQSTMSSSRTVQVPANSSVTLSAQGVSAPSIALVDTHTNQDTCQNAQLTLVYSGSAHS
jgi:hypothetical protein